MPVPCRPGSSRPWRPPALTQNLEMPHPCARVPSLPHRTSRSPSSSMSANSMSRVRSLGKPAKRAAVSSTKDPATPPCSPPELMKMRFGLGPMSPPLPTTASRSPSSSQSPRSIDSESSSPNVCTAVKFRPGCRSASWAGAAAARARLARVNAARFIEQLLEWRPGVSGSAGGHDPRPVVARPAPRARTGRRAYVHMRGSCKRRSARSTADSGAFSAADRPERAGAPRCGHPPTTARTPGAGRPPSPTDRPGGPSAPPRGGTAAGRRASAGGRPAATGR